MANSGASEIRVFDSTGSLVQTMGGVGAGPEEFQSLQGVYPLGIDSLIAYDPMLQRISVWSLDGDFARTISIRTTFAPIVKGWTSEGDLVISVERRTRPNVVPAWATYEDSLEVLMLDVATMETISIGVFPNMGMVSAEAPGGQLRIGAPLPDRQPVAVRAARQGALLAFPESGEVVLMDSSATPVESMRIELPMRARTDVYIDRWMDAALERAEPTERFALRPYFARFPQPPYFPVLDLVIVDQSGDLWVRQYARRGDRETLLARVSWSGEILEQFKVPAAFEPTQIGDTWILGILLGEHDEEMVAFYQIPTAG